MSRIVVALLLAFSFAALTPGSAIHAADCTFQFGFKTLHDTIPGIVGDCRTNEYHNADNGDGLQETAGVNNQGGLMVWRKADNWTAYTDGGSTWLIGPNGLQRRPNDRRFSWEPNPEGLPVVGGGQAAAPAPPAAAPAPPPPPPSSGFRIRIPSVGVNAPIVSVGLEPDGSMAAPDGPDVVGWFANGPRPGQAGNALMDGHVDWADRQTGVARTAVFYPLKDVGVGQDIVVDADGRRYTYRVREALVFAWNDPSALRVLRPSSETLITLITCEGTFDRGAHNYSHRRVIIAALVGSE
ncbi:MAG: class F sortase [Chloroflexi bacterium]|nr:class F sortase [Chloroflexota bacterium]